MKHLTIILLFLLINPVWANPRPKVTFISPDPIDSENEFWKITTTQIIKSAKDLGIDLEVLYTESHYSFYIDKVLEVTKRPPSKRPDYLMILPIKDSTENMLKKLENTKIKTFFINVPIMGEKVKQIGLPRDRFKNWIGHTYPDDIQASKLVTKEVSKQCGKNAEVIAINGANTSNASLIRAKVFVEMSKELSLDLKQSFNGNWEKKRVKQMLPFIEGRYPNICGFLVASDYMAEAIVESNVKSYSICSIDWISKTMTNIINKKQLCSVGGHFLGPAFALVTLFDYNKGIDFKDDVGLVHTTPFYVATKSNAQRIYNKFILNKNALNYKTFSKYYNKNIKKYNFNILKEL